MSKYDPLYDHLMSRNDNEWSTTFKKIESILGFKLPASAYARSAWWANNYDRHVQTRAWLNAGWVTQDLGLSSKSVTFVRKRPLKTKRPTVAKNPAQAQAKPKNHDLVKEAYPMSKYDPLYNHLMSRNDNEWSTTFKKIESILDSELPASAYAYSAWWRGNSVYTHVQKRAWLNAGWVTQDLSIPSKSVTFVRKRPLKTKKPTATKDPVPVQAKPKNHDLEALSEDEIKKVLETWLQSNGWKTKIAWAHTRGIDIEATGHKRWVIEVKGPGSRQPMRVNYFISILGETLQRMDDAKAKYSIALPDLKQYRGLWERCRILQKKERGFHCCLSLQTVQSWNWLSRFRDSQDGNSQPLAVGCR